MTLRAVVAMMEHETNTFSPVPTPLERFNPVYGADVVKYLKGTGTGLGAFLDLAAAEGIETVTPIAANASPSGPVQADAYAHMSDEICNAVAAGCDLCLLDLHGAMVAETTDDGEGTLLARIRSIAPDLPIAVSLDLHGNLSDAIVGNCTALVGYKTYPHLDMYEAGAHAGRIVLAAMRGEVKPVMAWGRRPLLAQTLCMGHEDRPMGPLIDHARRLESEGLLAASVFGGFPLADIGAAGLSVVTVADGDRAAAESACQALLAEAWEQREHFVFRSEPLADSVARAAAMTQGPVILLDHADNSASGGTQDTTAVLAEVLRQGLTDVAMFAICDPAAVRQMTEAGVGATLTLALGGKVEMPSIGRRAEPLTVTGRVRALTDGEFVVTVPMGRGTTESMGRSALLDLGGVQVVVISRHTEPFDPGCFRSLGVEPTGRRYLILKSRIHYRAGFRAMAKAEIPCAGVGVTSSDNALFDFQAVRRPIYPLDLDCPERPNRDDATPGAG